MKIKTILAMALITGCATLSQQGRLEDPARQVQEALRALEAGELYRARKFAEKALEDETWGREAEKVIAQILSEDIARRKKAFAQKTPDVLSPEEASVQVGALLERARSLLRAEQYVQALDQAEQVFLYDSHNLEASQLVDEIKAQGQFEEQRVAEAQGHAAQDEIRERLVRYRDQAQRALAAGRLGMAQMAVNKILLLSPKDSTALAVQEKIRGAKSQEGA